MHEASHNVGLRHPDTNPVCGATPDPASGWPYDDSSIQEYGYFTRKDAIVHAGTPDVMAACHNDPFEWLSPFGYEKLFAADGVPQPLTGGHRGAQAEQTYLMVRGVVYSDGTVDFRPVWQISTAEPPDNPPAGSDYFLELRDAGGSVLESHCFDASFYNYETGAETDVEGLFLALPLHADTAEVVLRMGATDVGSVAASDNSPTITVVAPNGGESPSGEVEIRCQGDDVDGDEVAYNVFYSGDDGASWRPVALDIRDTYAYTLDLSQVPGGSACRVRVEASDGFHTAFDESDGTFSVPDNPPRVSILDPENGATVTPPLNLSGSGHDLEEDGLEGTALTWTSNQDGFLGTGDIVWDVGLSPGMHELTLTGIDSQGGQGSDSVVVSVQGGSVYLPLVIR